MTEALSLIKKAPKAIIPSEPYQRSKGYSFAAITTLADPEPV